MANLLNKTNRRLIIVRPHVTEKATTLSAQSAYVFKVDPEATKSEVKQAIKERFGVEPIKINMINRPIKRVRVRGRRGQKSALRKAVIFLPAGTTIDIV